MTRPVLPNFLIAGGVASGTSFLSAMLAHHPDVYLPANQRPEPNFFHYTSKFDQGVGWYASTYFEAVSEQRAIGERSSLLLTSDVAPERIYSVVPNVKLIFCLRNPIERAWANYRFTALEGLEPLSFDEALDQEMARIGAARGRWAEVQPHAYLTRSRYARHLRAYKSRFPESQILVLKSEDLGRWTAQSLARVCEFLGVDPTVDMPVPPNYSSPSVIDPRVQVTLRDQIGDRFSEMVERIRTEAPLTPDIAGPEGLALATTLRSNLTNSKRPLSDDARARLTAALADELMELRDLVDFSIEDWA